MPTPGSTPQKKKTLWFRDHSVEAKGPKLSGYGRPPDVTWRATPRPGPEPRDTAALPSLT
jgi:hypothetical protein